MSTPKALDTVAQGKRHELRECRATLGYESNESSVEPNTFQQRGTLPRPKQARADFGLGNVPPQWIPRASADYFIPFVTQGGARFATANLRLPWASEFNAFGVLVASQSLQVAPRCVVQRGLAPQARCCRHSVAEIAQLQNSRVGLA